MLTCIACAKQVEETGGEDGARGTPSTKDTVKSLTSQIKDMALKLSGAHKQSKPSAGASSSSGRGQPACPDLDTICQGIGPNPYVRCGSTAPRWGDDFARANRYQPAAAAVARSNGGDDRMGGGRVAGGVMVEASSNSRRDVVLEEEEEAAAAAAKEWLAQVEPGVQITFVALPQGGNDLKRIRFSREMFNKWEAQRWWGENYDRIMELYNVQRFNRQALPTPPRSEDERESSYYSRIGSSSRESPVTPPLEKERLPRNCYRVAATTTTSTGGKGVSMMIPSDSSEYSQQLTHHAPPSSSSTYYYGGVLGSKAETSSVDASRTTTSSRDEASISISNVSDIDTEWVEQDEPGVYITIRALPDGTRELRRVRFSREKFGEVHAKLWWEQNRERIQAQYL